MERSFPNGEFVLTTTIRVCLLFTDTNVHVKTTCHIWTWILERAVLGRATRGVDYVMEVESRVILPASRFLLNGSICNPN
ncbi:hypothetical protein J6590_083562 [Homalodisca vitripennis]|nr:hypothetical protein J6590_083562 [Homalodisca vitripennis]